MPNIVKIAIIDNLDNLKLSIQDNNEVVKVTIVDGTDGKNGTNGNNGVNGIDWSNVRVNSVSQIAGVITLTTDNIPDYTDKRYQTDVQQSRNDATSSIQTQLNGKQASGSYASGTGSANGTNTGDETAATIGTIVNGATNYVTPLDADKIGIFDVVNSLFKYVNWINIKATLKTYFDGIYKATFSENTAFNKDFGTAAGTVMAGDDSRFNYIYTIGIDIAGQGNILVAGELEGISIVPFTGTIIGWYLYETSTTPIATTTELDVWKDSYTNFPPLVADTIWGTKPKLTAATKNTETGLAIAVTQYDTLKYKLVSNDLGKNIKLGLIIQKS